MTPASAQTAHDFTFTSITGEPLALQSFEGKLVLVVNTASQCGFTGQYEGLQKLWETYMDQGLVILGVPSNDFGAQEPGSHETIKDFCELNYGVTFPLSEKTTVKGKNAHAFYAWARQEKGMLAAPKWNFHKYLIDKNGTLVDWFATPTKPLSKKITTRIESLLD